MGKAFSFVFQLIMLALVTFGVHYLYHNLVGAADAWVSAPMELWQIYGLQLAISIVVIFAVLAIGKTMPQNLGFVFLGLLTLKLLINYIILRPVLQSGQDIQFFKLSYLLVFFLFMFFDVYVTYRVLNQTYSSKNN